MKIKRVYPVGNKGLIQVRATINGKSTAYIIAPGDDIANEPPEVQAKCNEAWTPEVKAAYQTHLESAI
jgi:hypothetical protein